jgi:ABC-type nitrate/sulfonate/bicarbonate transport system substrate-binding protein
MSLVRPKSRGTRANGRTAWRLRGRNVAVLTSVLVLAGSSAAYAFSESGHARPRSASVSHSSHHLISISLAYTVPNADQMLVPVTQAAGLFKKNGLNVKIVQLQASTAMPAIVSGQVQFVAIGAPSAEIAALGGTPLKYIGQWENVLNAGIVANKSIKSPKDLNGKTVAISSAGALSDFLVQIADHQYGINMHEVPLGNLPNETAGYIHGSVDAISGTNIWQMPTLESDLPGTHMVVDFRKDKGYPGAGGLVANNNWLKKKGNKAIAIDVLRALYQGIHYFKTHESKVVPIIATDTAEPTTEAKEAYQVTRGIYLNTIVPNLQAQKNVLKALAPTEPQAKSFNAKKLLDMSYAEAAEQPASKKKK